MALSLRPLGDRVLVIPDAKREQTDSGIILPQDRLDPDVSGVVAALGTRCRGDVAVGQHVTFGTYVGQEMTFRGTRYLILRESEISAALETA